MAKDNQVLLNLFGPRAPSEVRDQLLPVPLGKMHGVIPGSEASVSANTMDAGKAGLIFHSKIDDPGGTTHYANAHNAKIDGILLINVTLSGAMDSRFEGAKGSAHISPEKMTLFSSKDDFMRASIAPNAPFEFVSFTIFGGFILNMLEGERAPEILRKAFGNGDFSGSRLGQAASTPTMKRIARDLAMHPYHGAAETIYLQGKMLEMLAEAASTGPDGRKTAARPMVAARDKVAEAVEIMMSNPENPPSPTLLAQTLGVGYKTLNRGFAKYRGETVFQYARGVALDHAKNMLEETDQTVAEVAYRYGYCNASAFIAAYHRRFGQPPGAMRKGRR